MDGVWVYMGWKEYWEQKRTAPRTSVVIDWSGSRMRVSVPYHPSFIALAHKYQGKWKHRSRSWSFRASVGHIILANIRVIYADCPIEVRKRA